MEASELRIGNWLAYLGGERFQIHSADIRLIETTPVHLRPKPIPLTEEWLLRLGFESDTVTYSNGLLMLSGNSISPYYTAWVGSLQNRIQYRIEWVHQLQNLYFALTGEELEINEQRKEQP